MAHCDNLGTQQLVDNIRDIRGVTVRGADGQELGTVDDVLFDHDTMEIQYVVIDTGDGVAGLLVLPADRVSEDRNHEDGLATPTTKDQLENSPRFDTESLRSNDKWRNYEQLFKKYWEEEPVIHMKNSDHIITPPEEPASVETAPSGDSRSDGDTAINPAELFPDRISDVFSDPAPSSGKVTLRPKSAARAETAASGVTLLKPHWWEAFENYLHLNKSDIQSKCAHSGQERRAA